MSLGELILELIAWAPLIALLLSSLALVVLKRISGLPPWVRRLTIPPFYFVSLSIAMFTIGMEVMAGYVVGLLGIFDVYHGWPDRIFWGALIILLVPDFGIVRDWEASMDVIACIVVPVFFIAFWVAQFVSSRLLWRSLWRDDEREYPSNTTMRSLGVLLLLLVFVGELLNIRHAVLSK